MWIKRALLTNFGKHRLLDVKFCRGLNGLFGPNGCGKTTVLDGIYSAFTNDFKRFAGVKTDNISGYAEPGEESSIYIEGEHNGQAFQLYRGLQVPKGTPANSLTIGDQTWTKAPDIQTELETKLGLKRALLDAYVFVPQWGMFSFLDQQPGTRAGSYQMLCGTQKAETICKAIDRLLDQDEALTVEVIDNSDELLTRITTHQGEINTLLEQIAQAESDLLDTAKEAKARAIKTKRETYDRLVIEIAELTETLKHAKVRTATAAGARTSARATLQQLQDIVSGSKARADHARSSLLNYESLLKQAAAATRRLEERQRAVVIHNKKVETKRHYIAKLKRELAETKKPVLHPEEANNLKHQAAYEELVAAQRDAEKKLKVFEKSGVVECPTCGTPVKDLEKHLKRLRSAVAEANAKVPWLAETMAAIDTARDAIEEHGRWVGDTTQQLAAAEQELVDLQEQALLTITPEEEVQIPVIDPAKLKQLVTKYDQDVQNVEKAREAKAVADRNYDRLFGEVGTHEQRLVKLLEQRDASVVSDELLGKVTRALDKHAAAKALVANFNYELQSVRRQLKQEEEELEKLRTVLKRNAKARKFAANLKRLRDDVFHRQQLPQAVAQANLEDMEADINAELENFGSPFWVQTSEDLSFTVHHPGLPPQSALRLSGGQRGVLAVCFRTVLVSMFDQDIELLAMDEPTAGMDEQNVSYLATALSNYAQKVRGNRQIIMITHSKELIPAFDQVIELSA